MTLNQHVAARMRQAREATGFTQQQVAALVDTTQTTISRWERGDIAVSIDDLAIFADAVGKHIIWFFLPDGTQYEDLQSMQSPHIIEAID